MNTYIFYTDEGYTVSPNNEKLDNLQILGIEDGSTREEALANLCAFLKKVDSVITN